MLSNTLQIATCPVVTFIKNCVTLFSRHNTTFSRLLFSFFWKWHNAADRTAASKFYFCLQISVLFSARQLAINGRDPPLSSSSSFFSFCFLQAHNTYFRRDDAIDLIKKSRRRANVIGNRWSRLRRTLEELRFSLCLSSLFLLFFSFPIWHFSSICSTNEWIARRYIVQRRPAKSLGFHWARPAAPVGS